MSKANISLNVKKNQNLDNIFFKGSKSGQKIKQIKIWIFKKKYQNLDKNIKKDQNLDKNITKVKIWTKKYRKYQNLDKNIKGSKSGQKKKEPKSGQESERVKIWTRKNQPQSVYLTL